MYISEFFLPPVDALAGIARQVPGAEGSLPFIITPSIPFPLQLTKSEYADSDNYISPHCRTQWFPQQADIHSVAGQIQIGHMFEWFIQETKRRIEDGPEEWKQDARECLVQWENTSQTYQVIFHELELQRARETLDVILRDIRPNEELRDANAGPVRSLNTLYLLEAEISRHDPDWVPNELYMQPASIERGIDALNPEEGFDTLEPKIRQQYYKTFYLKLRVYDEGWRVGVHAGVYRLEVTDTERQHLERIRTDQPARYAEAARSVDEFGLLPDPRLIEHTENNLLLWRQRDMLQALAAHTLSEAMTKLQEFGSVVARNSRGLPARE